MDAFEVFKIILGLVISAFIIIMVMNFADSYIDINASKKEVSDLRAFERSVGDVYVNGIPSNYSFSDDAYSSIAFYRPPQLLAEFADIDFGFVPFFFKKGRTVSMGRVTEDLGWWRFDYIMSLPKTRIVFILVTDSPDADETVKLISSVFPDTNNVEPKMLFGVGCEGVNYYPLETWTRDKFVHDMIPYMRSLVDFEDKCVGNVEDDEIIIYISDETIEFEKGVLVIASGPSWGHIHTNVSGILKNYTYSDGLDIASFALGGSDFYNYKKEIYLKQLRTAADIKMNEITLLSSRITNPECIIKYSTFSAILQQIYDVSLLDYQDEFNIISLSENIKRSVDFYKSLEESGCA